MMTKDPKKDSKEEKKESLYFQFGKELDFPIFLKVGAQSFDKKLLSLLKELSFQEINKDEQQKVLVALRKRPNARLLMLEEASPLVARQIDAPLETDKWGLECITPKEGYRVYRHKGEALLVYSLQSPIWQLGCYPHFGSEGHDVAARTVLNRFLSWALAPLGVVGFWGVPVDEGAVILRLAESRGEAVFIDMGKQSLITQDGIRKIKGRLSLLKLDSTLKGRNIKMSPEVLMGFLNSHSSFFDYSGLSMPVRQMIQEISLQAQGLVHPRENFKPRTDLSL